MLAAKRTSLSIPRLPSLRIQRPSSSSVVRAAHKMAEQSPEPFNIKELAAGAAKTAAIASLMLAASGLAFSEEAFAAKSSGRVGGSSGFRAARSSSSSSYSGGALAGTRPGSTVIVHQHTPMSTMPFFFFPSFGYGYGYSPMGGFGGLGTTLLLVILAVAAFGVLQNILGRKNDGALEGSSSGGFFGGDDGDRVTVSKLQVGLLGSARSLQKDLQRIAGRADTSDSDGLHFVLQETVMALLRNPELAVYGVSESKNARGLSAGEEAFNSMSMEERSKFKNETFVNYGGRTRKSEVEVGSDDTPNELIVITLMVACEGGSKIPAINSREDLTKALRILGGVPVDDVLAVEVLWTPQAEGDYYTRDMLIQDYPTMRTL